MESRFLLRTTHHLFKPSRILWRQQYSSSSKPPSSQANPIGDYYASLLEYSTPVVTSKPPTIASPSSNPPISTPKPPSTVPEDTGPSILFSSRLSSPLERRSELAKKSTLIAGIWVPPKPEEPDNCCMSGCVNCVWDRFRDELEEWAAKSKVANSALRKERSLENFRSKRVGKLGSYSREIGEAAASMDDDGGGSEGLWTESDIKGGDGDGKEEDLFGGIPVGIREFMKQEKRLKEKHAREGTSGG